MEKNQQTDKPLFDNLRKLINLIDSFRDVGLHEHIELPRIAVLGKYYLIQELNLRVKVPSWKILLAMIFCPGDRESSREDPLNSEWFTARVVYLP